MRAHSAAVARPFLLKCSHFPSKSPPLAHYGPGISHRPIQMPVPQKGPVPEVRPPPPPPLARPFPVSTRPSTSHFVPIQLCQFHPPCGPLKPLHSRLPKPIRLMLQTLTRSSSSQSNLSNSLSNLLSIAADPTKMCGCCGGQFSHSLALPPLLASFLGGSRRAKAMKDVKKDTLLTPYEVEQLPLMLAELEKANRHFWQMVCWRMEEERRREEQQGREKAGRRKKSVKAGSRAEEEEQDEQEEEEQGEGSGTRGSRRKESAQASRSKGKKAVDDSFADGCALRELVRALAKTLCEEGSAFEDADLERMLADYRLRLLGEQWPSPAQQQRMRGGGDQETPGKMAERRRSFAQKGRAISFNGAAGLDKSAVALLQQAETKTTASSSSTASSTGSSSSGYSSSDGKGARGRAASWLRQRANSVRSRSVRRCSCQAQQRIAQLGELLSVEFHSTVYAHPELFDVHERELKVLVWRRFVQLMVALLLVEQHKAEQQQK